MEQIIKQRSWPAAVSTLVPMLGLLFLAAPTGARADDHYVAQGNQTPSHPYESWTTAASNIQDAISAAAAGDTVWVSNGVYATGGVTNCPVNNDLTNRVAITNAITVCSANNDPEKTIIKGAGPYGSAAAVRCVYMAANTKLIGFTLTNGCTYGLINELNGYGGGVNSPNTTAIISNCIFANNYAFHRAGVNRGTVYNSRFYGNVAQGNAAAGEGVMYDSLMVGNRGNYGGATYNGTFYNCTFISNEAAQAGGISAGGTLFNCMIISNKALRGGVSRGGVYSNCTIIGNSATERGGVVSYDNGGVFYNCAIYGNSAGIVGGVGAGGGVFYNCTLAGNSAPYGGGVSTGTLVNCIVYHNIATNAGGGDNWWGNDNVFTNSCTFPEVAGWAAGNITNDPVFVANGSGYGTNLIPGNYHLGGGSPCINAGIFQTWMTNAVDRDMRPRIRYGAVDMGAYERIHDASLYNFH